MEWTKHYEEKMEKLMKTGKFYDAELRRRVDEKVFELGEDAPDEVLDMWNYAEFDYEDEDDAWFAWHALAEMVLD